MFCTEIGCDYYGNRYFVGKTKNYLGHQKRYVLYNGIPETSTVPPGWHAWLHYLSSNAPMKNECTKKYNKKIDHINCLTKQEIPSDLKQSQYIKLESYTRWKPKN